MFNYSAGNAFAAKQEGTERECPFIRWLLEPVHEN
jgi:hypothetical protein